MTGKRSLSCPWPFLASLRMAAARTSISSDQISNNMARASGSGVDSIRSSKVAVSRERRRRCLPSAALTI
jgi:hypothetical protein